MLAPNTLLQNRYLIIRSIGHGGMGAVYLARDERLAHTVALKETFFTDERMRKAFEREARLLAHLRHPALPKVTDHFDEDGGQFIVMEFISGDDLEMLLAQRGKSFPVEQVLRWADELLKALDYLHKQDPPILHRDIKPANLKLTTQNEIILLDFGLAKGTAGQSPSVMTSKSIFGFTPNFAPLEQIQGTGTGPRSDLYSLAATLYYLMTGSIPPDALTRITEVANGQPDPLRRPDELNAEIPREVADILMKAMAHNRDHRPATADEMRRMLREVSPPIPSVLVYQENKVAIGEQRVQSDTLMPSTLVEAAPTQEAAAAAGTAKPQSPASTEPQKSQLETTPGDAPFPDSIAPRRHWRLPWAIAGFVALLIIGVTIGIVSNASGDSSANAKAQSIAAKDATPLGPQIEPASQQAIAAPDDSEITTITDASGAEVKTRTFRSHTRVKKVVVTTSNSQQSAKVFSIRDEERDLPADKIPLAMEASGDVLASLVGFAMPADEKAMTVAKAQTRKGGARPPTSATAPANQNSKGKETTTNVGKGQTVDQVTQQTKEATPLQNMIPKKGSAQPRAIKY